MSDRPPTPPNPDAHKIYSLIEGQDYVDVLAILDRSLRSFDEMETVHWIECMIAYIVNWRLTYVEDQTVTRGQRPRA